MLQLVEQCRNFLPHRCSLTSDPVAGITQYTEANVLCIFTEGGVTHLNASIREESTYFASAVVASRLCWEGI